jgi:uncharacterized coiled-coil protein SlyX
MNTATRSLFLACLTLACAHRPVAAQEPPPAAPPEIPAPPSFDELQAMIARMQRQLDGLGAAASERDAALRFLEQQVDQAAGQITGTGQANEALRGEAAALSTRMEDLGRDRERLSRAAGEQAATVDRLMAQLAMLTGELEQERGARAAETTRLTTELAAVRRELDEAHTLLAAAETRVDEQQDTIDGLDERLAEALAARVEESSSGTARSSSAACGRRWATAPISASSATGSCSRPSSCSPRARPRSIPKANGSCERSRARSRTSRPRSRPRSTGSCGPTATPTGCRCEAAPSARTGSCPWRGRSR